MGVEVYANGVQTVIVPATQSIAVSAIGDNPATVYQDVGYPNIPAAWRLIGTVLNTETVFGPFTPVTNIRIEAGANPIYYEVGASPVVGAPIGNQVSGVAPFSLAGLSTAQGGSVALTGGTSSTSGNAGGASSVVGGVAGATGVGGAAALLGAAGGATSGKGGAATVTGGAGTAGNASGGSVVLQPGAKNGSGLDGGVFNRGTVQFRKTGTPATSIDTATLSVTQMTAGILVATPTAAAAYTMPTGTDLKAALPTDIAAGDTFNLTIINLGGTGDDITLTASTDITIVGNPLVGPPADVATEQESQGTFSLRFVTGVTFVAYRTA